MTNHEYVTVRYCTFRDTPIEGWHASTDPGAAEAPVPIHAARRTDAPAPLATANFTNSNFERVLSFLFYRGCERPGLSQLDGRKEVSFYLILVPSRWVISDSRWFCHSNPLAYAPVFGGQIFRAPADSWGRFESKRSRRQFIGIYLLLWVFHQLLLFLTPDGKMELLYI